MVFLFKNVKMPHLFHRTKKYRNSTTTYITVAKNVPKMCNHHFYCNFNVLYLFWCYFYIFWLYELFARFKTKLLTALDDDKHVNIRRKQHLKDLSNL